MPSTIVVDCLLPTGVVVPLNCVRDWTLETIKGEFFVSESQLSVLLPVVGGLCNRILFNLYQSTCGLLQRITLCLII